MKISRKRFGGEIKTHYLCTENYSYNNYGYSKSKDDAGCAL